ncbi:hypothetical protein GEMRC1_012518 [Eukaryota sp. GEM-RC1]
MDEDSPLNFIAKPSTNLQNVKERSVQQSKVAKYQQAISSSLVELRIQLQKSMDDVSKLPESESFLNSLTDAQSEYTDAEHECLSLLHDLCQLNTELSSVSDIDSPKISITPSSSSQTLWNELSTVIDSYQDIRTSALTKYYNKGKISSLDSNLKALDQHPESIVTSLISHSLPKYESKSNINRAGVRRLGEKELSRREKIYTMMVTFIIYY